MFYKVAAQKKFERLLSWILASVCGRRLLRYFVKTPSRTFSKQGSIFFLDSFSVKHLWTLSSALLLVRGPQEQLSKFNSRNVVTTLRILIKSHKGLEKKLVFARLCSMKRLFWKVFFKLIGKNLRQSLFIGKAQLIKNSILRVSILRVSDSFSDRRSAEHMWMTASKKIPYKKKTERKLSHHEWKIGK